MLNNKKIKVYVKDYKSENVYDNHTKRAVLEIDKPIFIKTLHESKDINEFIDKLNASLSTLDNQVQPYSLVETYEWGEICLLKKDLETNYRYYIYLVEVKENTENTDQTEEEE